MTRTRRILLVMACLTSALILLDTFLINHDAWSHRLQIRDDLQALKTANDSTAARVEQLTREIKAFNTRRDVQERVIRSELGYIKPGEVIIRFPN